MLATLLNIVQYVFLLAGFVAIIASFFLYVRRTGDFNSLFIFWSPRIALTRREFFINRTGIVLMLVGVLFRMVYYFFYL